MSHTTNTTPIQGREANMLILNDLTMEDILEENRLMSQARQNGFTERQAIRQQQSSGREYQERSSQYFAQLSATRQNRPEILQSLGPAVLNERTLRDAFRYFDTITSEPIRRNYGIPPIGSTAFDRLINETMDHIFLEKETHKHKPSEPVTTEELNNLF